MKSIHNVGREFPHVRSEFDAHTVCKTSNAHHRISLGNIILVGLVRGQNVVQRYYVPVQRTKAAGDGRQRVECVEFLESSQIFVSLHIRNSEFPNNFPFCLHLACQTTQDENNSPMHCCTTSRYRIRHYLSYGRLQEIDDNRKELHLLACILVHYLPCSLVRNDI